VDATRELAAFAAVAGGAWLGSCLWRPLEAACLALVAAAWPILGWSIVQRSFATFALGQATPRLSQPFGYPNALGIFCALIALVALWLATRRHIAGRAVGGATLALALYELPLTGSRGSLLGLAVAIVLYVWLQERRAPATAALLAVLAVSLPAILWARNLSALNVQVPGFQPSTGPGLLAAGIATAIAGGAVAVLVLALLDHLREERQALAERVVRLGAAGIAALAVLAFVISHGGPVDAVRAVKDGIAGGQVTNQTDRLTSLSANMRSRWWSEAWHAFLDRPWHGWGAGTFNIVDNLRRPDRFPAGETHNAGLHVLSGLGLLGGIPALGALVASGWAVVTGYRRLRGETRAAGAAVLAALTAFAIHNQLDWDWTFFSLTLAAYPLVGVLATAGQPHAERRERLATSRRVQAALALPVLALAAVIALLPYLSSRAVARAETLDGQAGELQDAGDALQAATKRESALVELDLALGFEPVNYRALLDQAFIQVELARPDAAVATLRRAIRLEPLSFDAWDQLGQLQSRRGQHAKACATLTYAYKLSGHLSGVRHDLVDAGCPLPPR
jgi:hypothetical protein